MCRIQVLQITWTWPLPSPGLLPSWAPCLLEMQAAVPGAPACAAASPSTVGSAEVSSKRLALAVVLATSVQAAHGARLRALAELRAIRCRTEVRRHGRTSATGIGNRSKALVRSIAKRASTRTAHRRQVLGELLPRPATPRRHGTRDRSRRRRRLPGAAVECCRKLRYRTEEAITDVVGGLGSERPVDSVLRRASIGQAAAPWGSSLSPSCEIIE